MIVERYKMFCLPSQLPHFCEMYPLWGIDTLAPHINHNHGVWRRLLLTVEMWGQVPKLSNQSPSLTFLRIEVGKSSLLLPKSILIQTTYYILFIIWFFCPRSNFCLFRDIAPELRTVQSMEGSSKIFVKWISKCWERVGSGLLIAMKPAMSKKPGKNTLTERKEDRGSWGFWSLRVLELPWFMLSRIPPLLASISLIWGSCFLQPKRVLTDIEVLL